MLHKPAGTVSATQDKDAKTVLSLLTEEDRKRRNLFPVGRLDKDTEGLLFLTDDGMLSHKLISPKKHADKLYFAKLAREITEEDIKLFASGMKVDEELTAMPAELRRLSETEFSGFLPSGGFAAAVTLQEGKFIDNKLSTASFAACLSVFGSLLEQPTAINANKTIAKTL